MDSPADHVFQRKWAAPALIAAMDELSEKTGKPAEELDGMRLGDAYALAQATYGKELPEFWRVWSQWNDLPDDFAPMGDL